ncbi:IS5/IS1182 family transposase, partial [Streptococcus agalactiae]|nr:IS5/IS1182 family transposase [Streptococcus agalactiae]
SKIMAGIVFLVCLKVIISRPIVITIVKEKTSWINIPVCLQSDMTLMSCSSLQLNLIS